MYTETLERPLQTKPVTIDPLLLASKIAWLEKQPAARTYCYGWSGGCEITQYFRAMGYDCFNVGGTFFDYNVPGQKDFVRAPLPPHFDAIASAKPWTFGAALQRARDVGAD